MTEKILRHCRKVEETHGSNDKRGMHVGKLIKEVFDRQPKGCTVAWLASRLNCDRRNVYKIFSRPYIDTDMLTRVSKALDHDFFLDLSESMKKGSLEEQKEQV